jgi:hypothetical protein
MDLVALSARDCIGRFADADLEIRRALCKATLAAHSRFDSTVTRAACADASLALLPSLAAVRLAVGLSEAHEVRSLAEALSSLQPRQRREALGNWVRQLGRHAEIVAPSIPVLLTYEADIGAAARAQLAAVLVGATERSSEHRALARQQGALATLLTKLLMPGSPVPRALLRALSLSPVIDDQRAAEGLCARLGTEEAAGWLETLATKSEPAREAVLQVVKRLPTSEFEITVSTTWVRIRGRYKTPKGEPLRSDGRELLDSEDRRWLLTADGDVVLAGRDRVGCLCCHRSYVLADPGPNKPLRCPTTNEVHLLTGIDSVVLLSAHDLGACTRCDNKHALHWFDGQVVCAGCGRTHVRRGRTWRSREQDEVNDDLQTEGRGERSELFPRIPDELLDEGAPTSLFARLQPHEERALRATVTLHHVRRGKAHRGSGTGFIVARAGRHLAVLTTRHMFETDDDNRKLSAPRAVSATTVVGESVPVRLAWKASGALDIALCILEVQDTDGLATLALADDPGHLGDELVTFGNAGGFPWSMFKTRIAGVRDLPTRRGIEARWVQPADPVPRGMGGCALVDTQGQAIGLFSFLRVDTTHAAEIDLFLSSQTIKKALVRERVVFAGQPLVKRLGKASD